MRKKVYFPVNKLGGGGGTVTWGVGFGGKLQ